MPSTVRSLFASAAVTRDGVVRWGTLIPRPDDPANGTGVYVVALTGALESLEGTIPDCPISADAVAELLDVRPELTLDGIRPDADSLAARLAWFWCPDEVVVYIGTAGPRQRVKVSELSDRVGEYYSTPLGARGPHAGGWPLKTLQNLRSLHVHYTYCDDALARERLMVRAFGDGLSAQTRAALYDSTTVLPFANLVNEEGIRKAHGIRGARAPRVKRQPRRATVDCVGFDKRAGAHDKEPSVVRRTEVAHHHTQRVTAGDIRQGIVRIPRSAKALFPAERGSVEIDLHGERKSCRWDPRYGPDQERSGVLGIGRDWARRLLVQGTELTVRAEDGFVYLD